MYHRGPSSDQDQLLGLDQQWGHKDTQAVAARLVADTEQRQAVRDAHSSAAIEAFLAQGKGQQQQDPQQQPHQQNEQQQQQQEEADPPQQQREQCPSPSLRPHNNAAFPPRTH
jgi:hypothetical protein